jgi:hypothetical protein
MAADQLAQVGWQDFFLSQLHPSLGDPLDRFADRLGYKSFGESGSPGEPPDLFRGNLVKTFSSSKAQRELVVR